MTALDGERSAITARLDEDRRARSRDAAARPDAILAQALGQRPSVGRAVDAWEDAAGLFAQHSAAFGTAIVPGRGSRVTVDDTARAMSERAVRASFERVQAALGLHHEVEPPSLGLGR